MRHHEHASARQSKRFALAAQFIQLLTHLGEIQRGGPVKMHGSLILSCFELVHIGLEGKGRTLEYARKVKPMPRLRRNDAFHRVRKSSQETAGMTRLIIQWSRTHYQPHTSGSPVSLAYAYSGGRTHMKKLFHATGRHCHGRYEIHRGVCTESVHRTSCIRTDLAL